MLRSLRNRSLCLCPPLLAAALLFAPSAVAQRKKAPAPAAAPAAKAAPAAPAPKKKPAKRKRKRTKAAPATAAPGPAAEPEPETEPMPEGEAERQKSRSPAAENEGTASESGDEGEREKDKTDKDKAAKLPSLLDLEVGIKGFQRHLAYQDDVRNVIPDYDLGGAPAVAFDVGIFPVRTPTGSVAAGLTAGYESAFSLGTTYRQPQPGQDGTHTSSASAFSIGARVNFNFGTNSIGLGAEYGGLNFKVDLPAPTPDNAQVPDVEYRFIRPLALFRIGLGSKLALLVNGGYLHIMSAGEIVSAVYFRGPATSANGFDINAGVGWAPFSNFKAFELRPMLGWRRIAFTFSTDPNNMADPYIASGAHDDYIHLSLLLGLRL